jgi:tRNA 2-thiouridine synthesizing protein A
MTQPVHKKAPAQHVDLTGEVCPMTFVKAKLHLEELSAGEVLEIILKGGEQMQNVPRSIKDEGHRIESVRQEGDRYHLFVRKPG